MTELQKVQAMSDQELDMECGKVCGKEFDSISDGNCYVYLEEWEGPTMFQPSKKVYMTEVITRKAMEVNEGVYVRTLYALFYKIPYGLLGMHEVSTLLQATPRQRTEAAYMTLKNSGEA